MRKQRQAHWLKPRVRVVFISYPPPPWEEARNNGVAKCWRSGGSSPAPGRETRIRHHLVTQSWARLPLDPAWICHSPVVLQGDLFVHSSGLGLNCGPTCLLSRIVEYRGKVEKRRENGKDKQPHIPNEAVNQIKNWWIKANTKKNSQQTKNQNMASFHMELILQGFNGNIWVLIISYKWMK